MTDTIGAVLQRAREHRGFSLAEVSNRTKLTIPVLQAIERNEFERLPGGMFRKAYVKTVATEVGLDPDSLAEDYGACFESQADDLAATDPETTREQEWLRQLSPSPWRSLVVLVILLALAAAWFMLLPLLSAAGPLAQG